MSAQRYGLIGGAILFLCALIMGGRQSIMSQSTREKACLTVPEAQWFTLDQIRELMQRGLDREVVLDSRLPEQRIWLSRGPWTLSQVSACLSAATSGEIEVRPVKDLIFLAKKNTIFQLPAPLYRFLQEIRLDKLKVPFNMEDFLGQREIEFARLPKEAQKVLARGYLRNLTPEQKAPELGDHASMRREPTLDEAGLERLVQELEGTQCIVHYHLPQLYFVALNYDRFPPLGPGGYKNERAILRIVP
jgi:hypothetical protein